jgi:hypothetical protein
MMRRLAITLVGASSLILHAAPASATCAPDVPFDQAVRKANVVWWGTVTDAGVTGGSAPGLWGLTVQVKDGLKGPMPESPKGSIGTVFVSSCGPLLSENQLRTVAAQFLGTTRLFVGHYADGVLVVPPTIYVERLSPEQQYQRALTDLGLARPTGQPSIGASRSNRWLLVAAALAVIIAFGAMLMTHRHKSDEPKGQE